MPNAQQRRLVVAGAVPEPAVVEHTVLLVMQNPRLLRNVSRVLRASHIDIVTCLEPASAAGWLDRAEISLVVCDSELVRGVNERVVEALTEHAEAPPLILLSERQTPQEMAQFLGHRYAVNMVAKLGELDNGDLLVTARKLIEGDIFGVEKYLRWGSVIHTHRIGDSRHKPALLARIEAFLADIHCGPRAAAHLLTVADEVVMNALYDAPTDVAGNLRHHRQSRTEPVVLPEQQAAEVSFGSDGRVVVIGCRDPFGSLDPAAVRASLARCMRGGPGQIRSFGGGAGIGLFMIFQYVPHLVINLDPGRVTEFVAVLDMTQPQVSRHAQARSLNIFVKPPG